MDTIFFKLEHITVSCVSDFFDLVLLLAIATNSQRTPHNRRKRAKRRLSTQKKQLFKNNLDSCFNTFVVCLMSIFEDLPKYPLKARNLNIVYVVTEMDS